MKYSYFRYEDKLLATFCRSNISASVLNSALHSPIAFFRLQATLYPVVLFFVFASPDAYSRHHSAFPEDRFWCFSYIFNPKKSLLPYLGILIYIIYISNLFYPFLRWLFHLLQKLTASHIVYRQLKDVFQRNVKNILCFVLKMSCIFLTQNIVQRSKRCLVQRLSQRYILKKSKRRLNVTHIRPLKKIVNISYYSEDIQHNETYRCNENQYLYSYVDLLKSVFGTYIYIF